MRGKFEASLLGVAIGSAMASVGIDETRASLAQKYGKINDMIGGGKLNLEPGEYAGESQMMVSVLESLCTLRGFKPNNIALRFIGWLKSHPKRIGHFTQHVLQRMRDGERWEEASEGAALDSSMQVAGSASLIYGVPLGLYRINNATKMMQDTINCARITHWDDRCVSGSIAVNYALGLLVKGEDKIVNKVVEFANQNKLDKRVIEALEKSTSLTIDNLDTSGYCLGTLSAALWVLQNSKAFDEGIILAANLGGEAPDSVGALAGAFLGARYGRLAVPDRWVYHLVGTDRIEVLASRLSEHAANL